MKNLPKVLVFVFLAGLINLGFYFFAIRPSLKKFLSRQEQETAILSQARDDLQKELRFYKEMQVARDARLFQQLVGLNVEPGVLGEQTSATSSPILSGIVQIKSEAWPKIEVYKEPIASSKMIGTIKYGTIYFFSEKKADWYKIDYQDNEFGWVQAQFLEELP